MELSGGSWIWSGSLRYFFMVPFLLLLVLMRRNVRQLLLVMKENIGGWVLWSSVGFGLFYAPLCLASSFAPGWLIAGTWQITIISGSLLAPLFFEMIQGPNGLVKIRGKIPIKGLFMSLIILIGIALIQVEQANQFSLKDVLFGIIPVVVASFAYPLGNRKMMEVSGGRLDTYQRVLGMTLASLPFWLILSIFGLSTSGMPSLNQVGQSIIVAISSGVIATILFFNATDRVRGNMQKLAAVEATQSMEVLFTVFGELVLLSTPLPSLISWIGMFVIMIGMVLHSYFSHTTGLTAKQKALSKQKNTQIS
ncbi:multidrug resistance efflux transporter family protein [Terrilactibacillus sp. BCM23-1]|uniref:Multidrug resistance efflux transporter family protein n=2 Tax=Terrilactibacillus tamarindi TaxID=2599694 RepID=A0A6N8CS67_9BACI|nr:multidrug resistance efflux transporter family protein [Terrilactibacillus tamarindi]